MATEVIAAPACRIPPDRLRRPSVVRNRNRNRSAGFLLVEALATLAISAAILAALGSLLGMMSRHADLLALRAERLDVSSRALAAIARDIESMARVRWAGPGPRAFAFVGLSDRILFAVDRLDESRRPTTVAVLLQSAPSTQGMSVLRGEASLSPTSRAAAQLDFGESSTLYTGREPVRFAYVKASTVGGPEVLIDEWVEDDSLPTAIRVAFTDPATGDVLSSLRVPIRVEAEPGCAAPRKAYCSRVTEQTVLLGSGEAAPAAANDRAPRPAR